MKNKARIKKVVADGYERLLELQMESGKFFWCSHLQLDEYLEPGQESKFLASGFEIVFFMALNFVTKFQVVERDRPQCMFQPHAESPHTVVVGLVVEQLESDVYLVSISDDLRIELRFEMDVQLNVADIVCAEGELTIAD